MDQPSRSGMTSFATAHGAADLLILRRNAGEKSATLTLSYPKADEVPDRVARVEAQLGDEVEAGHGVGFDAFDHEMANALPPTGPYRSNIAFSLGSRRRGVIKKRNQNLPAP
jgi:hypothetical protein